MQMPTLKYSNGVLWDGPGMRLEIQKVNGRPDRFLKIDDLNPEVAIRRVVTRTELVRIGIFFIWRALFARVPH